jgi:hypothetical protein
MFISLFIEKRDRIMTLFLLAAIHYLMWREGFYNNIEVMLK